MNNMISIIVPVYKVEQYIDTCVSSLINQTYTNIEIILIDDGSPDNCPYICDRYAIEDSRIKVIHKSNGGLSDARNIGLKNASGDFVLFVDSDDYLDLNACERFIKLVGSNDPDIVVGDARRIEDGKSIKLKHKLNTSGRMITGKQYLKHELKTGTMYMASCFNLYKLEFLRNNKLEFKYGLLHEDEQFTPRVFLAAEKVVGSNILFYNYIIREDSITTSKNKIRNAEHLIKIFKELENIYNDLQDQDLKRLLNESLVSKYLNLFQVAELYKEEYVYLIDKKFLKGKAVSNKNKLKVFLFLLDKKLYYNVNRIYKALESTIRRQL